MKVSQAFRVACAGVALFSAGVPARVWAAPLLITHHGYLADSAGHPIDGTVTLAFELFPDATSGVQGEGLWREIHAAVPVAAGVYSVDLGSVGPTALTPDLFAGDTRWLEVAVEGEVLSPRLRVTSTAFALEAARLGGRDAADFVNIKSPAPTSLVGGLVLPGDGLTVGGNQLVVTGGKVGVGKSPTAALDVNGTVAAAGFSGDGSGLAGVVKVETDPTVNALAKAALDCPASQVAKSDGSGWVCAGDDDTTVLDAISAGGNLDLGGSRLLGVGAPASPTDATTKAYVDARVGPVTPSTYTATLLLKNTQACPVGFEEDATGVYIGTNLWSQVQLTAKGSYVGPLLTSSSGDGIAVSFKSSNTGSSRLCRKTYNAPSGRAHASFFFPQADDPAFCPSGYDYVRVSDLGGSTGFAQLLTRKDGFYLGYVDNLLQPSPGVGGGGSLRRTVKSGETAGVCFRVMGVDAPDPSAQGVFPVFLGVGDPSNCPAGWETASTASLSNTSNGYAYLQVTDNASILGGTNIWASSGDNYLTASFHTSHVSSLCWKYFPASESTRYQIRGLNNGTCRAGATGLAVPGLVGWNGYGYLLSTGYGMYVGGLFSKGIADDVNAYIDSSFTTSLGLDLLCVEIDESVAP